ncbi:host cell division inhibitor Icd-like protein [Trabulsiella odontotermitis]|uniref:host cell division inhibitor Icd-like protein n=1 Tax=Trabulsiella odontotermitis TaxID=379893 RepID=UPI0024B64FD3|nr:host cell division inhibitor Icd-like protein [Trabulsiella odontotermitis]WHP31733.1 host cell division inhibitor Icd-like protein [Trabulsiella odontotermitis]
MKDHITHPQGRNNYTWRFISMIAGCQSQRYIIVYTNAASEEEARANCPGIHLVFAARLPFQEVQL